MNFTGKNNFLKIWKALLSLKEICKVLKWNIKTELVWYHFNNMQHTHGMKFQQNIIIEDK